MDGNLGAADRSAAIVTIDPRTGYIKAMASSSRYGDSKFNLAAQGHRQAGSTFKVMVLMAALRRGVDPNSTTYTSRPLQAGWLPAAPDYAVHTYGNTYAGRINLVKATLKSDNSVYAQLDADVGPDAVRQTAYDMGIKTRLHAYPAEGLGGLTRGVSPLEMANAYSTIADGGWRHRPIAIRKVTFPDGHIDDLGKPRKHRAFSDGVTYEATKILEQNVKAGTGFPNATQIGCPAAGKTGTTDNFTDAWFVGFTPHLATSVWLGHATSREPMPGVAGGTIPAKLWGQYMKQARGKFCGEFSKPKHAVPGAAVLRALLARRRGQREREQRLPNGSNGFQNGTQGSGTAVPGASGPAAATGSPTATQQQASTGTGGGTGGGTGAGGAGGTGGGGRWDRRPELPADALRVPAAGGARRGRNPARGGRHAARLTPVRGRFSEASARGHAATLAWNGKGRESRVRGRGRRGPPQRDVPREARQRSHGPRPRRRQDAPLPDPHPAGRPRARRAVAVRPRPRPHRLPPPVADRPCRAVRTTGPPASSR